MTKVMRKEAQHTSVRSSTHDKGHEEGGSACKGGIEPQESPWKFLSIYPPKPESAYFLLCAFTYTSDFTGGCPPLPFSEKRVNLQLHVLNCLNTDSFEQLKD